LGTVNSKNQRTRSLVLTALIAAIYVTLVLALAPISYLAINIRVADALVGIVPLVGMPGVIGIAIGVFNGRPSCILFYCFTMGSL